MTAMTNQNFKTIGLMLASQNFEGSRSYSDMVKACRNTWADETVFSVYGNSTATERVGHVIFVETPESRENLLRKTIKGMELLLEDEFDYLFRPNCGSYVNIPLLNKFLENKPRERYYDGIMGNVQGVRYASGSCILMSRDVVELLVETQDELEYDGRIMMDDVSIGHHLEKHNILVNGAAIRRNCRTEEMIENNWLPQCYHHYFCHTINPKLIYKCHEETLKRQ